MEISPQVLCAIIVVMSTELQSPTLKAISLSRRLIPWYPLIFAPDVLDAYYCTVPTRDMIHPCIPFSLDSTHSRWSPPTQTLHSYSYIFISEGADGEKVHVLPTLQTGISAKEKARALGRYGTSRRFAFGDVAETRHQIPSCSAIATCNKTPSSKDTPPSGWPRSALSMTELWVKRKISQDYCTE